MSIKLLTQEDADRLAIDDPEALQEMVEAFRSPSAIEAFQAFCESLGHEPDDAGKCVHCGSRVQS